MESLETTRHKYTHASYGGASYYRHGNATFSFKEGTGSSLVVFFHGSVQAKPHRKTKTPLPVFYGLGRKIASDPCMLHFSDRLLEHYAGDDLELSWFLDTRRVKQQASIAQVIDSYRARFHFREIIFHGSSGGGHISLVMACRFSEIAVIANSQLFLERHGQWQDLEDILRRHDDGVEPHGLYEILRDLPAPRKVYDFCNTDDYTADHHRPVMQWIDNKWPGRVESRHFSGKHLALAAKTRNHAIRFPGNNKVENVLQSVIDDLA